MTREREVYVFLGDMPVAGAMSEVMAVQWLIRAQDDSVDRALRVNGYSFRTVGEFGQVCGTRLCTEQAHAQCDWESDWFRCTSCVAIIKQALSGYSEDGSLAEDDYAAMVDSVLAMTRTELMKLRR